MYQTILSCLFQHELTFSHHIWLVLDILIHISSDTLWSFAMSLIDFIGFLSIIFWTFNTVRCSDSIRTIIMCFTFSYLYWIHVSNFQFLSIRLAIFQESSWLCITLLQFYGNNYIMPFHLLSYLDACIYLSVKRTS